MPILATSETCTGCAACANICPHDAIDLRPDEDGFLMPRITSANCVECKLCEKACPIVNSLNLKNHQPDNAIAFWDNETRTESSSGGAFSAIARWIIERGGVVFGATWSDNFVCCHTACESMDELKRLRGSKYLQSDIKKTFIQTRNALKQERYVLFSGTPCQIAGLRSFLLKHYNKLVTIDIVCHGVPSNYLFLNYISKLKAEHKEYASATGFEFRNRRGWGYAPSIMTSKSKRQTLTGVRNLYMAAFDNASIFRQSCYDCRFNGLKRVGDITIADYWGIGLQGTPFRHDVTKGVSLILTNTNLGRKIIAELKECFIEHRPLNESIKYNHNLVNSSTETLSRKDIIAAFNSPDMTLEEINRRYKLVGTGIMATIRNILINTGLFWPLKSIVNKIRSL